MAAVVRHTLLAAACSSAPREVGAELRFATEVALADLAGYDLVVAADGASSTIRREPRRRRGRPRRDGRDRDGQVHLVRHRLPVRRADLRARARPARGLRRARLSDQSDDVSTFIVETDEAVLAGGRPRRASTSPQPPGPSDEATKAYLEELFADQIDGAPLLVNNSRWGNFRTRRTAALAHPGPASGRAARRRRAHRALLGRVRHQDGDGGRGRARARALTEHQDDLPSALAAYEAAAQPSVREIQDSARPSLAWWEHFGRYHDVFEPWQFGYHFLTRSISDARLARRAPDFVAAGHAAWRERARHRAAGHAVRACRARAATTRAGHRARRGRAARRRRRTSTSFPPRSSGSRTWPTATPPFVAVHGGTALTRTLVCEQARMHHKLPALLVDPELDDRPCDNRGAVRPRRPRRPSRSCLVTALEIPTSEEASVIAHPRSDATGWRRCSARAGSPWWGRRPTRRSSGAALLRSLRGLRRPGRRRQSAGRRTCTPRSRRASVDAPVDLAMICVPAKSCPAGPGRGGCRPVPAPRSSVAAASPRPAEEGVALQAHLAAVAAETGIRVLGPNTSGFLVPAAGPDRQLRAGRRAGARRAGRGRRGQRRGEPRASPSCSPKPATA